MTGQAPTFWASCLGALVLMLAVTTHAGGAPVAAWSFDDAAPPFRDAVGALPAVGATLVARAAGALEPLFFRLKGGAAMTRGSRAMHCPWQGRTIGGTRNS